jgi:hypothetical protein
MGLVGEKGSIHLGQERLGDRIRFGKPVPQGDLGEHLREPGSQRESGSDVEIPIRGFVKKDMETGIQAVFRQPVTDHEGDLRQRAEDHRYIRFELLLHLPAAENMNHVIEQVRVGVRHPFHGFLAALLKERIPLPASPEFPKGYPPA